MDIDFGELIGVKEAPVLPDPDEISYYIMEKERKYYLDYDVSADVLQLQRLILRWNTEDKDVPIAERKPIRIYIFSYGGEMDAMWSLIDSIMFSVTPIITINMGVAASAAALIFMSGHSRLMMPTSRIILHEGSAAMSGDSTKVLDASDSYRKAIKQMKEYILSRTSIPKTTLNKKRANDWEIDAKYCIENGVCTKIVESLNDII